MDRQSDYGAIRLTNRTALGLRRCARAERTLSICVAVLLSVGMAVAAVLLGIRWLPAVPLMTAATVLLDAAIYVRAHTRYMSLTAQAICTEASARQLRADRKEQERRAQARRDLAAVQADAALAAREARREAQQKEKPDEPDAAPQEEAAREDEEIGETKKILPQKPANRRRRQASLTVLRSEDAR